MDLEKTSYETSPVESPADALRAFVGAYDVLQAVLEECDEPAFADTLRAAMYRPVRPAADNAPISLYEIGVVYMSEGIGQYGINARKMNAALEKREPDVRALFVQPEPETGILPNLCDMLANALEGELHEFTREAASRFLNECRRLTAMWE